MNSHNLHTSSFSLPRLVGKLVLFALAGLMLSACGNGDMSDLEGYVSQARSKHQGTIEPLPAITPYESYQYHAGNERDPFKPSVSLVKSISLASKNGIHPDAKRNREELEKYDISALRMVGVMHNQGLTWGIIKAPDNSIYRVRKGNYMGQNHGKIINIQESKIELREIVPDGMGGWIERPNKVLLSE